MNTEPPVLSYESPPYVGTALEWSSLGCATLAVIAVSIDVVLSLNFDGPPADPLWVMVVGYLFMFLVFSAPTVGLVLGFIALSRTKRPVPWWVTWVIAWCTAELLLLILALSRSIGRFAWQM